MEYSHKREILGKFSQVVEKTKQALSNEGFGVLTEIDVEATLKKKLNVEYGKYVILGACNPPFAYHALEAEKQIGLFLPCNVIVYEDGGKTFVSTILPTVAMNMIPNPPLASIAEEVEEKLKKVINSL